MASKQPNIVFFFWDNLGWGELGCYGGGVLRGAPTPRIDKLASKGLKPLNHNVEAQCTPSRSAVLTGRHPIRSGTNAVAIVGPDGLVRWEVTIAKALSDVGYATGMWGKVASGHRPGAAQPDRLRVRRGGLVPTQSRRGPVDDAVVISPNGPDPDSRPTAGDPDPLGMLASSSGHWRGSLFASLEGSNRTREVVLCMQNNRLQASAVMKNPSGSANTTVVTRSGWTIKTRAWSSAPTT